MQIDPQRLEYTATQHIRDIFRANIDDPSKYDRDQRDWIFKGMPKKKGFKEPVIIMDGGHQEHKPFFANSDTGAFLYFTIEVWTRKMGRRDNIADQIFNLLQDNYSEDLDGDTLFDNKLFYVDISTTNDDRTNENDNVLRVKRINVTMNYLR